MGLLTSLQNVFQDHPKIPEQRRILFIINRMLQRKRKQ